MKLFFSTILFAIICLSSASAQFWQQTNGPQGGKVHALSVKQGNIVFAGTGADIYRSTDKGSSWQRTNFSNALNNRGTISSLFVDNKGRLLASLRYIGYDTTRQGLYRSTDDGDSWTAITSGIGGQVISSITRDPLGYYFVGTQDEGHFHKGNYGIYRSTDDGASWQEANNEIGSDDLRKSDVYSFCIDSLGAIYAGTSIGLFVSTDHGTSWSKNILGSNQNPEVYSLFCDKNNIVFAATQYDVFRSSDRGGTWKASGLQTSGMFTVTAWGGIFLANGSALYRSSNGGKNWVTVGTVYPDEIVSMTVITNGAAGDENILIGTLKGIMGSVNYGVSWEEKNNGLNNADISSIVSISSGDLYASSGYSIYHSIDRGGNWQKIPCQNRYIEALAVKGNGDLFVGGNHFLRSTNHGVTWETLTLPVSIYTLAVRRDGKIFAGSNDGLYQSTNNGDNWTKTALLGVGYIYLLAVSQLGEIYTVTDSGLYCSIDDGITWKQSLKSNEVTRHYLVVDQSGDVFVSNYGDLLRSTDKGGSWKLLNSGVTIIGVLPLNQLVIQSVQSGGYHFYRSSDIGDHWTPFGQDYPKYLYANSFCTDSAGFLYASAKWYGEAGRGVFRTKNSLSSVEEKQAGPFFESLLQNYPNPFSTSTQILMNGAGLFEVKDMLGKVVFQRRVKDIHSVIELDGRDLLSGLYLYSLTSGTSVSSKTMLVLK